MGYVLVVLVMTGLGWFAAMRAGRFGYGLGVENTLEALVRAVNTDDEREVLGRLCTRADELVPKVVRRRRLQGRPSAPARDGEGKDDEP
jgi:hypothetical protein